MPILRKAGDAPKRSLWQRIKDVALADVNVIARGGVKAGSIDDLEELLLEADFGVPDTLRLVDDVKRLATRGEITSEAQFLQALQSSIASSLRGGASNPALVQATEKPTIIVVIGVNGAGKTTFIGKLAARLRADGKRVVLAAADTFRAGAIDQLKVWAGRVGADFIGGQPGGDPAAVAFDAIDAAIMRGADVVIVDTAGRLHTSDSLMDELKKVVRVIGKRRQDAPHETLLVLDATIGQNAVVQAKTFAAAVPVTGLVVTKLDGTAKGGIVVAVHEAINAPVKFLGTGEQAGDLEPFDADAFAREVLEE
jgi:fused signal recognition particle receptor